jgi:hypothetical protein
MSSLIFAQSWRIVCAPFWRNASASTPVGNSFPKDSPLVAITGTCGKRWRTTASSSNPDIRGIAKSEMIISGSGSTSLIQRIQAVFCGQDVVTLRGQDFGGELPDAGLVIDKEKTESRTRHGILNRRRLTSLSCSTATHVCSKLHTLA